MKTLAEMRAILGFAEAAAAAVRFDEVHSVLLPGVSAVVGADAAAVTHLDLRSGREAVVRWPDPVPAKGALDGYAALARSHPLRPLLARRLRPESVQPVRISDVLRRTDWRGSELHRVVYGSAVDDQMSVSLARRGPVVHALTLSRGTGAFSDRQRDLVAACRPHLAAALRRADRAHQHVLQIAPSAGWVPAGTAPGTEAVARSAGAPVAEEAGALTPREREVVELVAAGLTDAQIARRLGLSPGTVSKHLHRIYVRLGLRNRAALTRYWHQAPRPCGGPAGDAALAGRTA